MWCGHAVLLEFVAPAGGDGGDAEQRLRTTLEVTIVVGPRLEGPAAELGFEPRRSEAVGGRVRSESGAAEWEVGAGNASRDAGAVGVRIGRRGTDLVATAGGQSEIRRAVR